MAPATTASPTPARSRAFDELSRFIVFLSLSVRALLGRAGKTICSLCNCGNCEILSGTAGTAATCGLAFAYCLLAWPLAHAVPTDRRLNGLKGHRGSEAGPVFRRRHPDIALEHAIEPGDRAEARRIDDLGNPHRGIAPAASWPFPHARAPHTRSASCPWPS